jgi:hypothetical protein
LSAFTEQKPVSPPGDAIEPSTSTKYVPPWVSVGPKEPDAVVNW